MSLLLILGYGDFSRGGIITLDYIRAAIIFPFGDFSRGGIITLDYIRAVIRFPSDLSQRFRLVLVLIESFSLSIHQRLFTFVQLHDTHLTSLASLFLNAHYHVFCSQQLKVVWSQCLNTESEGPALIFYKAQNWFTPILS